MTERIRPPYRPEDDVPFQSKVWRTLAALLVVLVVLAVMAGVGFGLMSLYRGLGEFLFPILLSLGVVCLPLALVVIRYMGRNDDDGFTAD